MTARQADARWVQGFLGHSSITTTERYLHTKHTPMTSTDSTERLRLGRFRRTPTSQQAGQPIPDLAAEPRGRLGSQGRSRQALPKAARRATFTDCCGFEVAAV